MTITWLIIEDEPARIPYFTEAILSSNYQQDNITWLFANEEAELFFALNPDFSQKIKIKNIKFCSSKKLLTEAITKVSNEQKDIIVFLDIKLSGINEESLETETRNNFLTKAIKALLDESSLQCVVVITSSVYNVTTEKEALGDGNKIVTLGINMNSTETNKLQKNANQAVTEALSTWNKLYGKTLESLWSQTSSWFKEKTIQTDALGHNVDFKDKDQHRKIVQNISIFKCFPNSWWETEKSIQNLHNALKCMCGNSFENGTATLSIGSVFLLMTIVCYQIIVCDEINDKDKTDKNKAKFNSLFKDFESLDQYQDWDVALLPPQDVKTAKDCIQNLYQFFISAFHYDHHGGGLKGECAIKSVQFRENGKKLLIQLGWDAKDMALKITTDLSYPYDDLPKIIQDQSHTRSDLIRFMLKSEINKYGFGRNSLIELKEGILSFEGFQKQC